MRYVIIGNSAAAVGCVEGIRQQDRTGEIIMVSDERHHVYSRPLISYLLCGKTEEQGMKYRPDDFYEKNNCTLLAGKRVTRMDHGQKMVVTEDGSQIRYDRLLIATGSRPFIPPIEGIDGVSQKHTFMSLDDAKGLAGCLKPNDNVLIIGAGLIGLKCAEGIHGIVKRTVVVDMADRILPSILDGQGAAMVQKHVEEQGIEFMLGNSVVRFKGDMAYLADGQELAFDVLVIAVGVRPNTELFHGKKEKGILTDDRCATSIPDVYAAGDCTESMDISCGTSRVLALLPNAYMQGECAGINMAGGNARYKKAMPMNAIGFFGLHMITAGTYDGDEYVQTDGENYKKLITKDGFLKGYILIGSVERAGIYTALIREQKPLCAIDFELIREKPQLMAFSKVDRERELGGVV